MDRLSAIFVEKVLVKDVPESGKIITLDNLYVIILCFTDTGLPALNKLDFIVLIDNAGNISGHKLGVCGSKQSIEIFLSWQTGINIRKSFINHFFYSILTQKVIDILEGLDYISNNCFTVKNQSAKG